MDPSTFVIKIQYRDIMNLIKKRCIEKYGCVQILFAVAINI